MDGRVWIAKQSCYCGNSLIPYKSNKAILIVRNPLDLFPSYA